MSNQTTITALIKSMSGQSNVLTIPRIYLKLLNCNHRAAILLSQCVYWSDKTSDPDGWFFKTDDEWREEIGMPRGGLETALKAISNYVSSKVALVQGTPKSHYRVDLDILTQDIIDLLNLDLPESSKSHLSDSSKSDLPENSDSPLYKTTTKKGSGKTPEPPSSEEYIPKQTIHFEEKSPKDFTCPYCDTKQPFDKQTNCVQCEAELEFVIPVIGGGKKVVDFKSYLPRSNAAEYLRTESAKMPTVHYRWSEFASEKERVAFEKVEKEIGTAALKRTIDWAVEKRIPKGKIVGSILKANERHGAFVNKAEEPGQSPTGIDKKTTAEKRKLSDDIMERNRIRQEALAQWEIKK